MSIGFIGLGHMGRMIVEQLVARAPAIRSQIVVTTRSKDKLDRIARSLDVRQAATNSEVTRLCDTVFICSRPNDLPEILNDLRPETRERHLMVAINNVVTLKSLEEQLPARAAKVIPSITHSVGRGISLISPGSRCTQDDREFLAGLMGHISVPRLVDEKDLRMLTNIASSGPAFFAYIAGSLAAATHAHGCALAPGQLEEIAVETISATAQMLANDRTCADLASDVATPGGMTAEGLAVLKQRMPTAWAELISVIEASELGKRHELLAKLSHSGVVDHFSSIECDK